MARNIVFILCFISFFTCSSFGQYTADKVVGQKNAEVIDSLKTTQYPYLLPIWGEKVARKGFKLPKSAGLSVQYITQQSDISISNLKVGFNSGPMYNLDQIVRFDGARTTSNGLNVRPDVWIFPFLNVYAIFAKSRTSTAVDCGIWLPDDSSWKKVTSFSTKANFDATTFGFGMTPTVGVAGFFITLDMNCTWSDISALDKPAFAFVFGPRIGKNITFKNKPERSLAIWAGGFRLKINTGTTGNLSATDLFPIADWQGKIDTGYMKVASNQQKVDNWWSGLTTVEQKNPVNIARHEAANAALAKAGSVLDQASQVVNGASNASVQYSLDKKPMDMWNFIIGTQFQFNRSWMIRAEYGFLGSRSQFIGGLQYRFDL